jgi:TRAP-type uncharacterized transport system substrate-binding protein
MPALHASSPSRRVGRAAARFAALGLLLCSRLLFSSPALPSAALLVSPALLVAGAVVPADATAEEKPPVWLASGPEGGTYRTVYATNLESLMRGTRILYRETDGSTRNLALLNESKADIGFVQADVYAAAYAIGETADIQVVGQLSNECIYIAYRVDGPVKSFDDLKSPPDGEPATVAVGPPDGGPAASWIWLSSLVPELAGNQVDSQFGTLAVNQLAVGRFDAVVWVTDPLNIDHKMLRAVNANDAVDLMPITDEALLEPLDDGTVVYRKQKVALEEGWRAKKLETICTSALVVMRRDADPMLVERVADLVSLKRDVIAPRAARP